MTNPPQQRGTGEAADSLETAVLRELTRLDIHPDDAYLTGFIVLTKSTTFADNGKRRVHYGLVSSRDLDRDMVLGMLDVAHERTISRICDDAS